MSNFKLDSDHDIIIGRGATRTSGDDYTIQLVKCRLLFILDTWELDTSLGLPWFQTLLVKDVEDSLFQGLIYDAIINTPGVAGIETLNLNRNKDSRTMNISFRATTISGNILQSEVNSGGSN